MKRAGCQVVVSESFPPHDGHCPGSRHMSAASVMIFKRTAGPGWATGPVLEAAAEERPASPAQRGELQPDPPVLPSPAKSEGRTGRPPGIARPARQHGRARTSGTPIGG